MLPTLTFCFTILLQSAASVSVTQADVCVEKLQKAGLLKKCHDEVKNQWKINLPPFPWEKIKSGSEILAPKNASDEQCNSWYGLMYCVVFTSCMNCTVNETLALEHIISPISKSIKWKLCSKWHIKMDDIEEEGTAICKFFSTPDNIAFIVAIVTAVFGLLLFIAFFLFFQYKKEEKKASEARMKRRSLSKGNKSASQVSKQSLYGPFLSKKTLLLSKTNNEKFIQMGSNFGA